jgi:hypothetical protein
VRVRFLAAVKGHRLYAADGIPMVKVNKAPVTKKEYKGILVIPMPPYTLKILCPGRAI